MEVVRGRFRFRQRERCGCAAFGRDCSAVVHLAWGVPLVDMSLRDGRSAFTIRSFFRVPIGEPIATHYELPAPIIDTSPSMALTYVSSS